VRRQTDLILLSPSDLANYLACPYLTTLEAEVARGERSKPRPRTDIAELVAEKGDLHEAAYLDRLGAEGRQIVSIGVDEREFDAAAALTEQALCDGAEVVYQAVFSSGGWRGLADFVIRVDEPSDLGDWSYEAWDTKLARSGKPAAVLQLVFYSQEIGRIQGRLPERLHIVPGTGLVETYRPGDFDAFFRMAQRRLQQHLESPPPNLYPWPVEHCSRCDFIPVCAERWRQDDHLTLVASIRRDQVERLNKAGVETLARLAHVPTDLEVPRLAAPMLERLRDQASLQLDRRETGELRRHLLPPEHERGFGLLPAPSPGDIFFDMEGDPFFEPADELQFLFGVLTGGEYRAIRARDRPGEKRAFEELVDFVHERRRSHSDLHVYHYAAYEPSTLARLMGTHATREAEVDELLRGEVFVDLFQVVRQSLRAGVPRYSLKEIEQFFFERTASVRSGDDAVVAFERYLATGDESLLAEIEAYNEEDCRATEGLRDWLLEQKGEAERQYGVTIPFCKSPEYELPEESEAELSETERLRAALLDGAEERSERWLMAQLLDYHRREARPAWWWYFRRFEMDDDELLEDSEAIAGLEWDGAEPVPVVRSIDYTFTFPPQQHHCEAGDSGFEPTEERKGWAVVAVDNARGTITLRRGKARADEPLPTALVPGGPFDTKRQREALRRLGASVLADDGRWPALRRILRRDLPLDGERVQRTEIEEQRALAVSLDGTYLYVQGPPGSGKTYRGAQTIVALIRAGKKVGVTSQSHKAIHNLLDEVERCARTEGVTFRGFKWGDTPYEGEQIKTTTKLDDILEDETKLIAGTAWLFAREKLEGVVNVLVIDEAGQISLADALAMGTSADSLILLGDPLQLAQVTQGVHPPGSGDSVLVHLLDGHQTIPEDRGIFLEQSRRMHPEVCQFISDAFYEGRLDSIEDCKQRTTSLGVGIRWLPVEHEGNRVDSDEEANAIAWQIDKLLDAILTDKDGTRPLRPADVMIVAPYNAQVRLLRERLPDSVEVGTVDKFQGREAAVVFYSMASSTGEDVPRGLDFLFSRNRLNVAISRAMCLAYLVCSPRLLEVDCRTIEHMRLANALCRFVELAPPRRRC
jgi:predicted RecB family nuclease